MRHVRVPPSKPITYSDLQGLLGPTSALRLNEPPKRKPVIKPVQEPKHKPTHQPWLEINIKMSVSPYKKSHRVAPSSRGKKKLSAKKKAGKKNGAKKIASRGGHTIVSKSCTQGKYATKTKCKIAVFLTHCFFFFVFCFFFFFVVFVLFCFVFVFVFGFLPRGLYKRQNIRQQIHNTLLISAIVSTDKMEKQCRHGG